MLYRIDRDSRQVDMVNRDTGESKKVPFTHEVFDLFSVIYYLRSNPLELEEGFTFDFLEERRVKTARLVKGGEAMVSIPAVRGGVRIRALKLIVEGEGIEVYVSTDELRLPLKLAVDASLPGGRDMPIEFLLERYNPGELQRSIPPVYRGLRFDGLL